MAQKSIIPSVDLGAKSPFNKKLTVLLVLVALAAIVASAMLGKSASIPEEEKNETEDVSFTEGTARNIQLEFEAPIPKAADSGRTDTESNQVNNGNGQTNRGSYEASMPGRIQT